MARLLFIPIYLHFRIVIIIFFFFSFFVPVTSVSKRERCQDVVRVTIHHTLRTLSKHKLSISNCTISYTVTTTIDEPSTSSSPLYIAHYYFILLRSPKYRSIQWKNLYFSVDRRKKILLTTIKNLRLRLLSTLVPYALFNCHG